MRMLAETYLKLKRNIEEKQLAKRDMESYLQYYRSRICVLQNEISLLNVLLNGEECSATAECNSTQKCSVTIGPEKMVGILLCLTLI